MNSSFISGSVIRTLKMENIHLIKSSEEAEFENLTV